MRLRITHRTEYSYDAPVGYALQRLRLFPRDGPTQKIRDWSIDLEGAREEVRFSDQFENETRLLSVEGAPERIVMTVSGELETSDTSGVSGPHRGFAPLWLFRRQTPLTFAGDGIVALADSLGNGSELDRLHELMGLIRERVAYVTGSTDAATAAEDALKLKTGVCQDHSHIFLAAARHLGYPARYVSGYLKLDQTDLQTATHAWAEAHLDSLGWVGFDCSNGISPDERYVRLALGRDYHDATPVSGIRQGAAREQLAVDITVEQ